MVIKLKPNINRDLRNVHSYEILVNRKNIVISFLVYRRLCLSVRLSVCLPACLPVSVSGLSVIVVCSLALEVSMTRREKHRPALKLTEYSPTCTI